MAIRDILVRRALRGEKNFIGRDLSRANLSGANLRRVNFYRADLTYAKFTSADLREADLTGADLREADLTGADLYKANLLDADLREADLTGAKLSRRQILDLRWELTIGQKMSLHGSIGMAKGDILSSKKSSENYRFVSYTIGVRGEPYANIVNTKSKKRYMRRMYEKESPSGYGILFYVKDRASRIFANY